MKRRKKENECDGFGKSGEKKEDNGEARKNEEERERM